MAKKGQNFSHYTQEFKDEIIKMKNQGLSHHYISKNYNVPTGTIMTWYHKFNRPELYPGFGLKKGKKKEENLTKEDYKERYEIVKKYQAFLKAQREKK